MNDEVFEVFMTFDEFDAHGARGRDLVIFDDGRVGYRDVVADHRRHQQTAGNWPMVSEAMGVHPDDNMKATKEMTRLGIPTEHRDGCPVFTSPTHRKAYCEALGFYDRNGGYSDPQRRRK